MANVTRELALALLERSIEFGHPHLAVVRLSIAVHARADIPEAHWAYCTTAAKLSSDAQLESIMLEARTTAMQTLG